MLRRGRVSVLPYGVLAYLAFQKKKRKIGNAAKTFPFFQFLGWRERESIISLRNRADNKIQRLYYGALIDNSTDI